MLDRRSFCIGLACGIAVPVVVLSSNMSAEAQTQPATSNPIVGVWRVVEQTINGRTLKGDQLGVGYHIWTRGYFCAVRESDVPPRPNIDTDGASAEQLRAVWGPFVAQLGTYQFLGDRFGPGTTLVAKNPGNMRSGDGGGARIRFERDRLIWEPADPNREGRRISMKMVRVE